MYSVSKEMPLQSYQIVSPADNATDFKAGQVIRFNIPRQVEFFDAQLSRVQFDCKTSGANYKMAFSSDKAGVASMIDMVRVSQNGKVISEIQEYATLQHFLKSYENTLSTSQIDALSKGCVDVPTDTDTFSYASSNSVLCGQSLNRTGEVSMTEAQQDVKFQMTLDFVSLFEALHVVPVLLMGDILVEIRLVQDDNHIMKVLPSTGVSHTCGALTTGDTTAVLTPAFKGFTNVADSPFVVGMKFETTTGTADYTITALSQTQAGVITATFTPSLVVGDNGDTTIKITKGSDGLAPVLSPQFIVSKAELQLQIVKPPESYISSLISQVEGEGFMLDLDTYSTYRSTIQANIKAQTITIPTTQSRCKAVFSVPRAGNQVVAYTLTNATDYRHEGVFDHLRNYRSQYNGGYYPNQPVDLSQMVAQRHFSQEHLRELEKSLESAGIGMKSCECLQQNFVMGRALSQYGSSTNLQATPINLYLEYNINNPLVKDVVSYVCHIVRVMITPQGIETMV
jgi:hypothetical protein